MIKKTIKHLKVNPIIHLGLISLATVACYWGVWNAYFISDDYWMFGLVRHIPRLSEAIWAESGYGIRPLLDLSMWVRVRLFDLNSAPYYLISVGTHLIVVFMVYWMVGHWTNRRSVAFLSAIIFGTTFSHHTVITWIVGSEYSQATILYLATVALFALYLERVSLLLYVGSVVTFIMCLLYLEVSVSLPLVLLAYHLTLGHRCRTTRFTGRSHLLVHLPYWILFFIYLSFQLQFIQAGTSEASVAEVHYGIGFHMVSNLYYLVHLILPNVNYYVLSGWFGQDFVRIIRVITVAIAILANGLAIYGIIKGSPLVKFAIAFIYLTFFPYTLWQGRYAGAIRYMYLPSIGFSIISALLLLYLCEVCSNKPMTTLRYLPSLLIASLIITNIIVIQIWVQRHVQNSAFRRAFVSHLAADYSNVEPGAQIYIEVPDHKYIDLGFACDLVIPHPISCESFVSAERQQFELVRKSNDSPVYFLQATQNGLKQVYPAIFEVNREKSK